MDLTLSDDEAEWPPAERAPKRQRRAGSAWGFQDDLDDVVLVDESELRRERQQQQPAAEEELDEDLVCLESHGDVWNKNLPHTRDTCGEAAFSKQQAVGNAQHCAKCYCWVCDCLASECGDWGDGSTYQHHCHAHAGHAYFAALKQQRKRAATAAAAAAAKEEEEEEEAEAEAGALAVASPRRSGSGSGYVSIVACGSHGGWACQVHVANDRLTGKYREQLRGSGGKQNFRVAGFQTQVEAAIAGDLALLWRGQAYDMDHGQASRMLNFQVPLYENGPGLRLMERVMACTGVEVGHTAI